MIQYTKVGQGLFIQWDDVTHQTQFIVKAELNDRLATNTRRLNDISVVTDKELLAWARQHYPFMDYSAEIASLEQQIAADSAVLDAIKSL